MKNLVKKNMPIADAISNAHGDLIAIGEEMREWADNLEERFSNTEKYERVSEAADVLENLTDPNIPEELLEDTVSWTEKQLTAKQAMRQSRPSRRDSAVQVLDAVVDALQVIVDDESESQKKRDAAESLRDEVEELKNEADGVEFPGAFG